MSKPAIQGFYPILDPHLALGHSPFYLAEQILASGVGVLQLRQKGLSDASFLNLAMELSYLKIHNQFSLIVNHHVEVAQKIGAEGVHLTGRSMGIAQTRKVLGPKVLIGSSIHTLDEALKAQEEGADYVSAGAVFETRSKSGAYSVLGLNGLKEIVEALSIPVVAIGGISLDNLNLVKQTGALAFSALSYVYEEPQERTLKLMHAWNHS